MMSIAQRNAETVAQNQSEAGMNEPIPDDPFAYHEFEIRRLEKELKAARGVVDAARVHHVVLYKRPIFKGIQDETYIPCECCICEGILKALKIYDEARRG